MVDVEGMRECMYPGVLGNLRRPVTALLVHGRPHHTYIEVQNQVKYGGQMDFFLSRCFRKLLNTEDKKVLA